MDNIGLDLHQRESRLCILTATGELIEQRIATTRALVRTRTRYVAVIKALVRRGGLRLAQGDLGRTRKICSVILKWTAGACAPSMCGRAALDSDEGKMHLAGSSIPVYSLRSVILTAIDHGLKRNCAWRGPLDHMRN
jgi:hypothetical protein